MTGAMKALRAGSTVLAPDGTAFDVDEAFASEFRPGDRVIADPAAGLLRIPREDAAAAHTAVGRAAEAFERMGSVDDHAIGTFYERTAEALADDLVWREIAAVNATDVEDARARGRSTTRLAVSDDMRAKMIEGMRGWANAPSRRGALLETIRHDGFRVEMVGAALGVVAFVFEGRPNVLADACGVLRGGNTVVFRIGSDALESARSIMRLVIDPALRASGLPQGTVSLVDSAAHAAGWAVFLDQRLSLAVARGSGHTVELLGSLARGAGTPASLHGTGGAWVVASQMAQGDRLKRAVVRSLDRKVCNTLNTCCLVGAGARDHARLVLEGLREAGDVRGQPFKLHVAAGDEDLVPPALFEREVRIGRARGTVVERQAEVISREDLGIEWEWEEAPEITLVRADSLDEAVALFNTQSPRLVGALISEDPGEHRRFFETLNAPFVGDGYTRWVDGQFALNKPELGLSNWQHGRLFARGAVLTGDSVYTVRTRYVEE